MDEEKENGEISDAEIQEKIQQIEESVDHSVASHQMPEVPEWEYKRPVMKHEVERKESGSSMAGLAFGLAIGYSLIGPVLACWGLGWLYDHQNDTTIGQMIGVLLGSLLGILATILILSRHNRGQ